MKLLIDEHFSPSVGSALRPRGHDVVTVSERDDLRGMDDIEIMVVAAAERRVIVTGDVRDFVVLGTRRLPSRKPHAGIVLVPQRAFPRFSAGIGRLVRALDAMLVAHPGNDDLMGEMIWLRPVVEDRA